MSFKFEEAYIHYSQMDPFDTVERTDSLSIHRRNRLTWYGSINWLTPIQIKQSPIWESSGHALPFQSIVNAICCPRMKGKGKGKVIPLRARCGPEGG
jgi:hypothetical protein